MFPIFISYRIFVIGDTYEKCWLFKDVNWFNYVNIGGFYEFDKQTNIFK